MYSALLHDIGKAECTKVNDKGKIVAYGHEKKSAEMIPGALKNVLNDKDIIKYVEDMTLNHMSLNTLDMSLKNPDRTEMSLKKEAFKDFDKMEHP